MDFPSFSAKSKAFFENLTEGNAYIAPYTSLHLMFVISFNAFVTNLALYFNESNKALYSVWNLVFVC